MGRPYGHKLDKTDIRIIGELQKQPRLGYQELGKLVGLTYTPCRLRVKRLIDQGYITKSISIQPEQFFRKHSFCVLVELADTSRSSIDLFIKKILSLREADLCWELNGTWDFVVRLHVEELRQFEPIRKTINELNYDGIRLVLRTQSFPIAAIIKGLDPVESLKI